MLPFSARLCSLPGLWKVELLPQGAGLGLVRAGFWGDNVGLVTVSRA